MLVKAIVKPRCLESKEGFATGFGMEVLLVLNLFLSID